MVNLTRKLSIFSDGEISSASKTFRVKDIRLTVPDDGYTYLQTLHDYEVYGEPVLSKEKYAIPAICNDTVRTWYDPAFKEYRAYDYVGLTEAWQRFLFDLWKWSVDDLIPMGKWEGTYKNWSNPDVIFDKYTDNSMLWYYDNMIQDARSHTDARNVQGGYCDYVTQRNMGKLPYEWLTKSCTGNILRAKRNMGTQWEVEALDLSKAPPKVEDVVNKPWLIHWATEHTTTKLPNGSYAISRYPQVKVICRANGWEESGTPIPNTSLGGSYYIKSRRVRVLKPGQSYSPYIPMK